MSLQCLHSQIRRACQSDFQSGYQLSLEQKRKRRALLLPEVRLACTHMLFRLQNLTLDKKKYMSLH